MDISPQIHRLGLIHCNPGKFPFDWWEFVLFSAKTQRSPRLCGEKGSHTCKSPGFTAISPLSRRVARGFAENEWSNSLDSAGSNL
jgi:hypothetical protein